MKMLWKYCDHNIHLFFIGFARKKTKEKYYVHNIFTTNYRWLVVISSNLNLTLRLLFLTQQKQLVKPWHLGFIVKMLWTYHFSKQKPYKYPLFFAAGNKNNSHAYAYFSTL